MRVPSPREEISRKLPFILAGPAGPQLAPGDDKAALGCLVDRGFSTLRRRAAEGDEAAMAALAIAGGDVDDALDAVTRIGTGSRMAIGVSASGGEGAATPVGGLYGAAMEADAGLRENDAALLLAALSGTAAGEHDGMLGLAVLALRRGLIDEAGALVTSCLAAEPMHPRAGSIFAICELERGRAASGQAYLAAACRHARAARCFRDELRIAQRALLLMHLG